MRIIIIGAGKTGAYLAERLRASHSVAVLDVRPDRIEAIGQEFPDIEAIVGDACEPLVLEHARVADADIVAAVTGDDEDNLVVAMLAKHFGVPKVYGRVNHPDNEWLFDEAWGVDDSVSSPSVLYGLIDRDLGT